ncbi:hypothetical protein L195_g008880 [Trifolium pratense]|uniref:Retrotransposon-derived protein PEG10-like n=1 Tax=Trifolium pratense TaxID=57577 RepID=A0A2K3PAH9_TRIPR|nr:hypothetical protein L195_g008880 [Trifolium pratense]
MTRTNDRFDELSQQITLFQAHISASLADVSQRVASLERSSPDPSSSSAVPPPPPAPPSTPRLKLDLPRFDGQNASGWIFKISQFFTYHHTPEEERITIASFYLDGPALSWYQWMYRNGQILSWH